MAREIQRKTGSATESEFTASRRIGPNAWIYLEGFALKRNFCNVGVKGAWISEQKLTIDGGTITSYRVIMRVSFVID